MEIIDLEEFSEKNPLGKPEKGKTYQIRVDRNKYVVDVDAMTGKEILELANKNPYNHYQLNQKLRSGTVRKINYEELVDFTEPGIERFMTIPLQQQEGSR
ncbi:multiubiquitin domain-containing protein [Prolixibacter denitrificans]|uniref:Multiubiquitin n=1 Tax=Prolixibacter denitrificans TaxID=1541063 RepID=A0A2P8CHP5_9BACT|nr:multiubiquitin domain-containing protein [Prolixibacter denitrificans]PSK84498.1 multiubiquitin [Prolixibacter denitrificans]GET20671.1 hypothetical protein JCM18694_09170 [Prolixibacter denitrificans]